MEKAIVKVRKIRSYQTLVYKRGNGSFRKQEYKDYIQEISLQIGSIKPIEAHKSIRLSILFASKNRSIGDIDNIAKPIMDILQLCGKIPNDKQVEELHLRKSFGHKENSIVIEIEERE